MSLTVQKLSDIFVQDIYPPYFGIYVCNQPKQNVEVANYFNAGFFAQDEKGTLPVGNLMDSGILYAQAKDNPSWINVSGKQLSTLWVKKDGSFALEKTDTLENKNLKTAISGIPIVADGKQVSMQEIKQEGYAGNELYYTWHGFLGIRGKDLVYVGAQCEYRQMAWILLALGIRDAIKLDGGGSYILHNDRVLKATDGNRVINNVGMWHS